MALSLSRPDFGTKVCPSRVSGNGQAPFLGGRAAERLPSYSTLEPPGREDHDVYV
ncbi:MAG: hypothetical protein K0Q73_4443 [Paenibacillus sp.]|nr:hypothetical protein [Paenibacillus sp.]